MLQYNTKKGFKFWHFWCARNRKWRLQVWVLCEIFWWITSYIIWFPFDILFITNLFRKEFLFFFLIRMFCKWMFCYIFIFGKFVFRSLDSAIFNYIIFESIKVQYILNCFLALPFWHITTVFEGSNSVVSSLNLE